MLFPLPGQWLSGKESACQFGRHRRCRFDPWVGKMPWRSKQQPTPVFLPGKSHGQRSLEDYSLFGVTKSWTQLSDRAHAYFPILFGVQFCLSSLLQVVLILVAVILNKVFLICLSVQCNFSLTVLLSYRLCPFLLLLIREH